jgi:hypothetical protein
MSAHVRVFIGSATESISIAKEVETMLATRGRIVDRWDKAFSPSVIILTELASKAAESDFGIFVFSPDDSTVSHRKQSASVRDNVIFEAGIFIGSLGTNRTFILEPLSTAKKIHVPSDFGGVVRVTYKRTAPRSGSNGLNAAVAKIAKRMDGLGPALRNPHNEMTVLRAKLQEALVECTDGFMSVLDAIEPIARAHNRTWSVLSRPELLVYPLQETLDDDLVDEVYWWLVVEGVFKFQDPEKFGRNNWGWRNSIEWVEVSNRGAVFLNMLRSEKT